MHINRLIEKKIIRIQNFEFYNNARAKILQRMILNNRLYSITAMNHSNDSRTTLTLNLYLCDVICHNNDSQKNFNFDDSYL